MKLRREAKQTLSAVEMHVGDTLEFKRLDGWIVPIHVVDTKAASLCFLSYNFPQ